MDDFRAWHAEALDRGAKQKLKWQDVSGKCGTYNFCTKSKFFAVKPKHIVLEGEEEANFKKGPVGWGGNQYFLCTDCTGSILRCLDAPQ